jgi:hypothetical protein
MRLILTPAMLLVLASCAIQSNEPDYQYPAASDTKGAQWPDLVVTADLRGANVALHASAAQNQQASDHLAARALALRERVKRLQQQTVK